eukprot:357270-Chlamydomonas_euryale.AAC.4
MTADAMARPSSLNNQCCTKRCAQPGLLGGSSHKLSPCTSPRSFICASGNYWRHATGKPAALVCSRHGSCAAPDAASGIVSAVVANQGRGCLKYSETSPDVLTCPGDLQQKFATAEILCTCLLPLRLLSAVV